MSSPFFCCSLRLFRGYHSFVRMRLVVEFEGIVSVVEVLLGLRLYLRVSRNPVEKSGAVAHVFGVAQSKSPGGAGAR